MGSTEEEDIKERIRLHAAALKEGGLLTHAELEAAGILPVPGNANRYVPWSDPQIPYECVCGQIIYADTPHVHFDDVVAEIEQRQHERDLRVADLRRQLSVKIVVKQAIDIFGLHEVKHYYQDRGDEYRTGGRAFEAGDAVRAAMELLGGIGGHESEYDEVAPNWWPEAEYLLRAEIPNYDEEIARRQKLGYEPE